MNCVYCAQHSIRENQTLMHAYNIQTLLILHGVNNNYARPPNADYACVYCIYRELNIMTLQIARIGPGKPPN